MARVPSVAEGTPLVILTVLLLAAVALGQTAPDPNSENLTPSQLHQILAQGKAESLARARSAQALSTEDSPNGQTNYDVTFYDVTIRVDDTAEVLYGSVKFVASATEDNVSLIDLDLVSSLSVDGITSPGGALTFTRTGNFVTVTLAQVYDEGEVFEFDISYSGHPPTGGLQAFSFDWYNGHRSISSLSEPYFSRSWWPCKDRMDDKPDSLDSHLEVATGFYCASNGILDSIQTTSPNSRMFHYRVRYPMATYLFSMAIAPFAVWQQTYTALDGVTTMPVIYHVYPSRLSYSYGTWGKTPDMITELARYYGEYPFLNEKYGHSNFEWSGAMEHQTNTSFTGDNFGFSDMVIVHELSHQWWGDMITCKSWHDIWLNEGWATYSEALYVQLTQGWTAYHNYMNSFAYKGSGSVYCYDTTSVSRIFSPYLSYDKGGWVVHMLRGVLGETLFKQGVDGYYESEYKYKAATTEEFKDDWEASTGVELDWFIEDWVYGDGYPKYQFYYLSEAAPEGGYNLYMMVGQTQGTYPQVFRMPVDFYMTFDGAPGDTLTLTCDERRKRLKLHFDYPVTSVTLDPQNWILRDAVNYPWTFFIVTLPEEISGGERLQSYVDTVETRGGSSNLVYAISSGALPNGLTIDNSGVISGTPTVGGAFEFTVRSTDLSTAKSDSQPYTITIDALDYCCQGRVGNANGEGGEEPTIGDISAMVDLLFISGNPVACLPEADVNQSGGYFPTADDITIGDISILIDHLFVTGVTLANCY